MALAAPPRWRHGKLACTIILVLAAAALLWFIVFPWLTPELPVNRVMPRSRPAPAADCQHGRRTRCVIFMYVSAGRLPGQGQGLAAEVSVRRQIGVTRLDRVAEPFRKVPNRTSCVPPSSPLPARAMCAFWGKRSC